MPDISLFWHRRDLRIQDNLGLAAARKSGLPVVGFFCFDRHILDRLPALDRRLGFIHHHLKSVQHEYSQSGGGLIAASGQPLQALKATIAELREAGHNVVAVHANRDYAPYPVQRDADVAAWCGSAGVAFELHEDHVIMPPESVLKDDGTPYTVFTPYSKKWHRVLEAMPTSPLTSADPLASGSWAEVQSNDIPTLESLGFDTESGNPEGWVAFDHPLKAETVQEYAEMRDTPSAKGTTRMSLHLRFGTVSVRSLTRFGMKHSDKWLTELIWREFYQAILHHFPHSASDAFRAKYDRIPWRHDEPGFAAWCEGRTGYPMVDAGMRELNATGFMHNRVRMVVASFLCKHLLIDWRWGERYFAEKLLDYELASNVGGWQWASGSGCDAAPYFRVFNPESQMKKFDPKGVYVKRWVPEWGTPQYAAPIVEHKMARQRAIDTYKAALAGA
ncbi:MAG: DNA photolyase family protein [Flavobacteriales bacterium]|nr:DNA photolyase family protein [Flavobacteriales bacterium]